MTREELNKKLDKLYAKSDEVKSRLDAAKAETRDAIEDTLAQAEGDAACAKDALRQTAEAGASRVGADMLKLQMTVDKIKEDLRAAKGELDKTRMAALADELDAYAADAVDFAAYAMDEAVNAALEAAKTRQEYEAQYGK